MREGRLIQTLQYSGHLFGGWASITYNRSFILLIRSVIALRGFHSIHISIR